MAKKKTTKLKQATNASERAVKVAADPKADRTALGKNLRKMAHDVRDSSQKTANKEFSKKLKKKTRSMTRTTRKKK